MRKIGDFTKKLSLFLLMAVCCASLSYTNINAANEVSVKLPIEQIFTTNDAKADDVFSYTLKALDSNHPMPADCENGSFCFSIAGNGAIEAGPISYMTPGVYTYRLEHSQKGTGYSCSIESYQIDVHVMNDATGGLVYEISAHNSAGEKVEKILFEHEYKASDDKGTGTGDKPSTGKPSKPSKPGKTILTGDQSSLVLLFGIFAVASVVAIVIVSRRRREKNI